MGERHVNAASDMYRYDSRRNRGIMGHYDAAHGADRPGAFAVGTAATFAKEILRLAFVERKITRAGWSNLWRGLRDGRTIARDRSWRIMEPLAPAPRANG